MQWVFFWLGMLTLVVVLTGCSDPQRFDSGQCASAARQGQFHVDTALWVCELKETKALDM